MAAPSRRAPLAWEEVKSVLKGRDWGFAFDDMGFSPKTIASLFASGELYRVSCHFSRDGQVTETREVLVKRSQYAHLEYKWLQLIRSSLGDGPVASAIPQAMALLDSDQVLITDFFDSTLNLHQELMRASMPLVTRIPPAVLRQAASLAGKWLAEFQEAMYGGKCELLAEEIEEAEERMARIPLLTKGEKKRILGLVESVSHEVGPIPCVITHGDFAPRNILFSDDAVHVIDWEMVHERPRNCLFDVHHFVATLSKPRRFFSACGDLVQSMAEDFKQGYLTNSPFVDHIEAIWKPARLVTLVTLLSRQHTAAQSRPIRARVTGKSGFLSYLVREIRREL